MIKKGSYGNFALCTVQPLVSSSVPSFSALCSNINGDCTIIMHDRKNPGMPIGVVHVLLGRWGVTFKKGTE